MDSEQGDYIGQGRVWNYQTTDGTFSASRNYDNGVSIRFENLDLPDPIWWDLDFAAPGAEELVRGPYEGAERFPFQPPTKAGLSVSGDGRGCSTLTGRFDVLKVEYGSDEEIIHFAASFEQHCEGEEPALFGEIHFNSTVFFLPSQN